MTGAAPVAAAAASAEDHLMAWSVTGTLVAVLGGAAAWLLM